jgi:two-component system phosphate regulon sensor histidine kinase PhoR
VNEQELERKAAVAELLLSAARQLGETHEPDRVYDRFHELLAGQVPHDGVVVSSYDESDELIRCDYAWVEGNRIDPTTLPPLPLNRQGGMQSQVIVSGEPLLFNDVVERVQAPDGTFYNVDSEGTVRKLPESGPSGTTAAMMVPVAHEGRVVGVVQVMADSGSYSPEQLELVEGLVVQMAAAVRNARLQRERLRAEAAEAAALAVASEREQAAQVLDAVGDGIFLVDGDGVVRLWNRAAALATGLRSEHSVGRRISELLPEWEAMSGRIPVAERGLAARSATLPLTVGGTELWLSFVAVQSTDDGVVYAFRDLTGERRLEEEKSDLVATISHELRTPMAAVYGAAQTLLRPDIDPASEQGRRLLEMIASQAARLSRITEEVLLASRLDRGDVTIERGQVDVGELVRATAETMRHRDAAPIALEVPADVPQVAADSGRLQQVLVNLLDNATKYGGDDTVTVRVEDTDATVRISVADTGPGIQPADQERIFEKFYRSDPHVTYGPSGTGLGLYISRELVRRMGGRLDVRSEPGAGATFVVDLPRAQIELN